MTELSPISFDRISKTELQITVASGARKAWLQELKSYTPSGQYKFKVSFKRVWKYGDESVTFKVRIHRSGDVFKTSTGHFIKATFDNIEFIEYEDAVAFIMERGDVFKIFAGSTIKALEQIGDIRGNFEDIERSLLEMTYYAEDTFRKSPTFLTTGGEGETFLDEFMMIQLFLKRLKMTLGHAERLLIEKDGDSSN